eukprot:COSAG02_NODE_6431_length_3572_cov_6.762165_5_plen_96_part_00
MLECRHLELSNRRVRSRRASVITLVESSVITLARARVAGSGGGGGGQARIVAQNGSIFLPPERQYSSAWRGRLLSRRGADRAGTPAWVPASSLSF